MGASYICFVKAKNYRNVLVLIVLTAVVLITAQVYFTLQNYRVNQQRFINDVQIALDLSVEKYFSDEARTSIQIFTVDIPESDTSIMGHKIKATVSSTQTIDTSGFVLDTLGRTISYKWSRGSSKNSLWVDSVIETHNVTNLKKISLLKRNDTLTRNFKNLTDKVMLSFSEELLDLGKLYDELKLELERKNLTIEFALQQESNGRTTKMGALSSPFLSTYSKSSYLGRNRSIQMHFENATIRILKRGMIDLTLSILIVGLVIGTMLYLYRILNRQKQLAEIKDDLISNITHEFKTPIATIYSALEGVTNFNEANDPAKTKKYLSISNDQLTKLNSMVEKLLETATIDKGKLVLNKEEVELTGWTQKIVDRFQVLESSKSISTIFNEKSVFGSIDVFHLENTLANLLDNAIKYGGDTICVKMYQEQGRRIWEVEDDGGNIPRNAQEQIFEKLYRVPKGNTHDVKGFGIGLYYARTIAELHEGTLSLEVGSNKTLFKLIL